MEAAKEQEAQVHGRKESADSQAANLELRGTELAAREEEVLQREQESRHREEQFSVLEDQLNREREALETRENMVGALKH
jgi:flagellar motility protein MotE (MotC chaperone)